MGHNLDPDDVRGLSPREIRELLRINAQLGDPCEYCPGCDRCER